MLGILCQNSECLTEVPSDLKELIVYCTTLTSALKRKPSKMWGGGVGGGGDMNVFAAFCRCVINLSLCTLARMFNIALHAVPVP